MKEKSTVNYFGRPLSRIEYIPKRQRVGRWLGQRIGDRFCHGGVLLARVGG